ncbi:MAG TPA: Ppx/GppA phosphatase family protein [Jatrophihabitantaceae bacterium]|nr:Ppx/GppA phosphatase family protein [Jatrophihabitantaceae bacterium]
MRLGVLDVGSNTVHLLVVDAHRGAQPTPQSSQKSELRLAEHLGKDGKLSKAGADALVEAVIAARKHAKDLGCDELLAFATSAVRDASNSAQVLERVEHEAGVELSVLSGEDEARLTFLAVRRWLGWSAGNLICLDIGGGSLEIAAGRDEDPDVAFSLPLGAARLTREWFDNDPPAKSDVARLREHVVDALTEPAKQLLAPGPPDRVVATSKTFRTLARLAGAAPSSEGPYARRIVSRTGLTQVTAFVSRMTSRDLAELDGVSVGRAHQTIAGAVVAAASMDALEVDELELCPWALREGVILRRLDWLSGS